MTARSIRSRSAKERLVKDALKISTFNVNGIASRLPLVLDWLAQTSPDVVCLQELKAADDRFPVAAIEAAGYGAIWQGQKSWNGVAILARGAQPIETQRGLPGDPADVQSRYIEAAAHGAIVGCLYAPNGNPVGSAKFAFKLRWYDRFVRRALDLCAIDAPVVLAGDFNIIPTDADVYVPDRWRDDALFQPALKETFVQLCGGRYRDALRWRYPDTQVYTFWKHLRNSFARDAGLRIDHVLLNPTAADLMTDAGVDRAFRGREKPSDHAAVWVTIRPPGESPRANRAPHA